MTRFWQISARDEQEREFADYYAAYGPTIRKIAYLLCGDWHLAEDLTQTAFTKLYLAWRRIRRPDSIDAYVRTLLMRTYLDEKRRPWRRERVTELVADAPAAAGPDLADRLFLLRALARLPPGQRAVLVLRYWADLTVDETARNLGCSAGNVKSQSARGLANLRRQLSGTEFPGTEFPGTELPGTELPGPELPVTEFPGRPGGSHAAIRPAGNRPF